jgi:hypothetical protein
MQYLPDGSRHKVCHTVTGLLNETPRPVLANAVKQSREWSIENGE